MAQRLVTNFTYVLETITYEPRLCVRNDMALFVNWFCIESFGIPARQREELFIQVLLRWSDFKSLLLLFAFIPIVFLRYSVLAIWKARNLLIHITVDEHSVYTISPFSRLLYSIVRCTTQICSSLPGLFLKQTFWLKWREEFKRFWLMLDCILSPKAVNTTSRRSICCSISGFK